MHTTVELRATVNPFRGFLIQAREGSDYVGSFTNLPPHTQTLACDASNPSVGYVHEPSFKFHDFH